MTGSVENTIPSTVQTVPICAIGASAGGVTALRSLFGCLPSDLGLAYVVILHLSPEHPSVMAEILSASTTMRVHQVNDTSTLRPNCVYVIPPDRELVIQDNNVHARPFSEPRGRRAAIDMFFRSVAAARGDGMAVVLSGSGSDGSLGVKAIYEGGGVVFVQEPTSAEFPMMPQNAIATGVASFIGPLERLAERIGDVARSKEAVRSLDADGAANDLRRVVRFLHARTGHDFSNYKRATVMRRVARRMQVCRLKSIGEYADYLRDTPEEAQELFSDLLISVTMFFRDEATFDVLAKQAIAPLFDNVRDEGIRAWVVGCATGEEAYSVAILMLEEAARRRVAVPIQIFASDLDDGALATAREGRYPRSIEADVTEARLKQYFHDEGAHYRIRKEVRDLVLFASHSVLKDPPFLRLDLITCRNLLIYLERGLQQQLAKVFHYALVPHGFLFLGSAETVDSMPRLYAAVDRQAHLYQTHPNGSDRLPAPPLAYSLQPHLPSIQRGEIDGKPPRAPAEIHIAALEKCAPPSALVDADHQILHLSPNAGRFIQPSGGQFSVKLTVLIRQELRLDLQVALDRALLNKQPTMTSAVQVAFEAQRHRVNMYVQPVVEDIEAGNRALVLFFDLGPVSPEESDAQIPESWPEELRRVYSELRMAQESLVTIRGEHESSMQELRAANEELQSLNEEYRSTSEELETSKEELQSMNEELQTVNSELKSKLTSISTAHSDLQNLTAATEIGTLFLDSELHIRMFTPPVALIFNITEADVGRKITDFTHRLAHDGVEPDAMRVLRDLVPVEREVETRDGRWFMMRLRPYRTVENRISGVVVSFVEISGRVAAEYKLADSELRYRKLFDSIDQGFCVIEVIYDESGKPIDYLFEDVNAAFERQTGLNGAQGKRMRELQPSMEDHWFEIYGRVALTSTPERFEAPAAALGRYYEVFAFPYEAADRRRVGILFNDVSERKREEEHRELLTHELSHRVKNTLAVVQSLANLPAAAGTTIERYRQTLTGRIQALALAHRHLLDSSWQAVDLRVLVDETLSAYCEAGSSRCRVQGERIELPPKQGLSLALFLHELATNAGKYGALSNGHGQVHVSWKRDENLNVKLNWVECDGPRVEPPKSAGFGMKLIKDMVAYELSGKTDLRFDPSGLHCELVFPLGRS
jgi:two-component system, chemotaxis family, CheB/CheR fusion protein